MHEAHAYAFDGRTHREMQHAVEDSMREVGVAMHAFARTLVALLQGIPHTVRIARNVVGEASHMVGKAVLEVVETGRIFAKTLEKPEPFKYIEMRSNADPAVFEVERADSPTAKLMLWDRLYRKLGPSEIDNVSIFTYAAYPFDDPDFIRSHTPTPPPQKTVYQRVIREIEEILEKSYATDTVL